MQNVVLSRKIGMGETVFKINMAKMCISKSNKGSKLLKGKKKTWFEIIQCFRNVATLNVTL